MSTPPRLEACYFTAAGSSRWPRLAAVLESSARRHCPAWQITVDAITPAPAESGLGNPSHAANTSKLEHWAAVVQASAEGDRLLLIDADTLVLRPLDPLWDLPFDLAYTLRVSGFQFPFNGGVLGVRVSDRTKAFFAEWIVENRTLLADTSRTAGWRWKYGGVNQASFAQLLKQAIASELQVHPLSCVEWNCENSAWPLFNPAVTRILHIKDVLRRCVFVQQTMDPALKPLARLWHEAEASSYRREARA